MKTIIISLGGSIIAPNSPDTAFIKEFKTAISDFLKNNNVRLILVIGGGGPAREWQKAAKTLNENADTNSIDSVGIAATRLNAEMVRVAFGCKNPVVTNPTEKNIAFDGNLLIASGWKPGFSTDTDAVYLCNNFNGKLIINLSNIEKVYTSDPKVNKNATPLTNISWDDFRKIVGNMWTPGGNFPFDPVASKMAQENNVKVICANGRNIKNTINILSGKDFVGTTIG